MNHIAAVEALILASGKGIEITQIANILEISKEDVLKAIQSLQERYNTSDHGVSIHQTGTKYIFYTKTEYAEQVAQIVRRSVDRLTPSQLEVLAIMAKKGAVTKSIMEQIRGKSCDSQIAELLPTGLIRRKRIKSPGRPFAYSLTEKFYDLFQLGVDDLIPYIQDDRVQKQIRDDQSDEHSEEVNKEDCNQQEDSEKRSDPVEGDHTLSDSPGASHPAVEGGDKAKDE